jgi:HK97 family phage portal protein
MKVLGYNIHISKRNDTQTPQPQPQPQQESNNNSNFSSGLLFGGLGGFSSNGAMRLSAVYRAVDLISDSIAMLPLETQITDGNGYKSKFTNHPTYSLLNKQPNRLQSRFTFIKLIIQNILLQGNGFAYIVRDAEGNAIRLQYLRPENVVINYNEVTGSLSYGIAGFKKFVEPCNMLHFKKYTVDGVTGISVLQNAFNTLQISNATEQAANNFFSNGCNLSGVLTVQGQLNDTQKEQIRSSWAQAYSGTGSGLAVLQGNMQYSPIQINSKDAQLLESRQFNLTDIARFFGISPVLLGDLSHSSYSTIEATMLSFLSQTLQPFLELLELEISNKLFRPSENNLSVNFDDSKLIKTDKAAIGNYYQTLFNIGAMTINEVRKDIGLNKIVGGDNSFVQLNLSTVKNIVENDTKNVE